MDFKQSKNEPNKQCIMHTIIMNNRLIMSRVCELKRKCYLLLLRSIKGILKLITISVTIRLVKQMTFS